MSAVVWPFGDIPRKHFRLISVDAPHRFYAGTKGRPQHYKRMTDHEIAALPVKELMHPEGCWLIYWSISSKTFRPMRTKQRLRPDEIAHEWGCRFSSRFCVWIKTKKKLGELSRKPLFIHRESFFKGLGLTTRKNAEDGWLFRYGAPPRMSRNVDELIISPVREHSRKPDEAYDNMMEFGRGPYLELFSRENRPGWSTWGDEAGKFDERIAA